jgi:hypothetical protein
MIRTQTSPPTVGFGACLLAAAVLTAVLMHLYPEKLRVPAWVAFWAAALLGLAGVCIVMAALRLHSSLRWLVCGILAAMAVIPGWIATSSAATHCSVVSNGLRAIFPETGCRVVFGLGAVVLMVMFGCALRDALRKRPRFNEKASE